MALGVDEDAMLRVLRASYKKSSSDFGNAGLVAEEAGDVLICAEMLAHRLGFSLQQARNTKMKKNRLRTPAESLARRAKKKRLGIG